MGCKDSQNEDREKLDFCRKDYAKLRLYLRKNEQDDMINKNRFWFINSLKVWMMFKNQTIWLKKLYPNLFESMMR